MQRLQKDDSAEHKKMVAQHTKLHKASKKLSKLVKDCNNKVEELEMDNEKNDSEM